MKLTNSLKHVDQYISKQIMDELDIQIIEELTKLVDEEDKAKADFRFKDALKVIERFQ